MTNNVLFITRLFNYMISFIKHLLYSDYLVSKYVSNFYIFLRFLLSEEVFLFIKSQIHKQVYVGGVGGTPTPQYINEVGNYSNGGVSSDNPICSQIGSKVLMNGGNAIDAAVATEFCLCVTNMQATSLGGGGKALIYIKKKKMMYSLNYRELSPMYILNATADANFRRGFCFYNRSVVDSHTWKFIRFIHNLEKIWPNGLGGVDKALNCTRTKGIHNDRSSSRLYQKCGQIHQAK